MSLPATDPQQVATPLAVPSRTRPPPAGVGVLESGGARFLTLLSAADRLRRFAFSLIQE